PETNLGTNHRDEYAAGKLFRLRHPRCDCVKLVRLQRSRNQQYQLPRASCLDRPYRSRADGAVSVSQREYRLFWNSALRGDVQLLVPLYTADIGKLWADPSGREFVEFGHVFRPVHARTRGTGREPVLLV